MRRRQPCAVCEKTVLHFDGERVAAHVRSKRHREAAARELPAPLDERFALSTTDKDTS